MGAIIHEMLRVNKKNMKGQDSLIYILLGTYNGSEYLNEMLQSIVEQSHQTWHMIIRDDSSQDRTVEKIKKWVGKDRRIQFIEDKQGNLGAALNFFELMEVAMKDAGQYFAFADQDDVWKADKLKNQISKIKEAENKYGKETPILIHSDLEVVDKKLNLIHKSFMNYQQTRHEEIEPLKVLIVQNFVTGCSAMFNRSLLRASLPVPEKVVMHDWWLALNAAAFGKILFLKSPLIQYRQHSKNEVGAKSFWEILKSISIRSNRGREYFLSSVHQAKSLLTRIKQTNKPGSGIQQLLEDYISMLALNNRIKRLSMFNSLGIRRQNTTANLLFKIKIFLHR